MNKRIKSIENSMDSSVNISGLKATSPNSITRYRLFMFR